MTFLRAMLSDHLPDNLHAEGDGVSASLLAVLSDDELLRLQAILSSDSSLARQFTRTLVGSAYVLDSCCRNPDLLFQWLLIDVPHSALSASRIVEMAALACCDCETVDALDKALRQLRRRLMVGVIWRDVNRLSDFSEVCQSMTAMAEAAIQQTVDFHYRELSGKHGTPIGAVSGLPQQLVVLGMGKLGGGELNLSSDIDLIFAFPESGDTDHPKRPLDNQSFFIRLGQRVIKALNDVTVDGFVFRVDMRLRPYGQSGALVSSFASLENYYQTQGRDWERFAAIKARVVACSSLPDATQSLMLEREAVEGLNAILQPFTYRKYTDFSVIESLRKLKAMIVQEVRRKGMETNVKLGAGGIRELEFITQAFQLVSGGREVALQERHWLSVLKQLQVQGVFDALLTEELRQAYVFLRETEHGIQAYRDQQTQQLPDDPQEQIILAWVMGFDGESAWQDFSACLKRHRDGVDEQFQLVIADPDDMTDQVVSDDASMWLSLWLDCNDDKLNTETPDEFVAFLQEQGYLKGVEVIRAVTQLRDSWAVKQLSAQRRESLDTLMPQLFVIATQVEQSDTTALRLLTWLGKIVGRSSYITLLVENPQALKHLADLFQGSVWVAELMAKMPALLDEMLDMVNLYTLPTKTELQNELRVRLLRTDADDVERVMEVLRYFKLSHCLRVAASELSGRLPLMKVSDYLTWIAEVVLEQVLILAWDQLSAKHGVPQHMGEEGDVPVSAICPAQSGFIIVAYGKMGGIELSYGSDLDLVFIYQAEAQSVTDGVKPIDAQTFYARLGQKIIHILNTRTLSGPLYEVDMRLRPSGNSGLLATSIQAFSRYQDKEAWTWEHQALVRARPITGDAVLMDDFIALRKNILQQVRDIEVLRADVISMRQKMRDHLGADTSPANLAKNNRSTARQGENESGLEKTVLFHLKQDAGGIVDIEFMVQYAVLAWSHKQANLAEYTDNIRILEQLQSSACVNGEQGSSLIDIYQAYRAVTHRLALQEQSPLIQQTQLSTLFASYQLLKKKSHVEALWQEWVCDSPAQ
jgi:[glutamine synthetase] adenylyltransferase / [glutamine synthetase]-adenylyl-L-tyrosine phosphorylase